MTVAKIDCWVQSWSDHSVRINGGVDPNADNGESEAILAVGPRLLINTKRKTVAK